MEKLTLTEIVEFLNTAIIDTTFDIQEDWNEEKELMKIQLQSLIIAKANLDLVLNSGGQIFSSSINK